MSKVKNVNKIEQSTNVEVMETAKQKGRPVNPDSNRQKMLQLKNELREQGLIKRGRPVNGESKRQLELSRKQELKELGLLSGKKGRPVNPNSNRQQVLNMRQNGEMRKPGRPKVNKEEVIENVD
jgi:hypothetical protein